MNIWPRSEASRANVKFWGQSLSQGHYQPIYQQAGKGFIYNGNWTEWSAIWSEIIRVISKSNERAARVRFEITSMISDQNCTTRSSITTLLNPFWNRPNTGLGQIFYWWRTSIRNRAARALFLATRKFYCIASADDSAATARKCYYIHHVWNRPNTGLGRFKYFIDAILSWFWNKKQNQKRFYIKIRNRAVHDLKLSCTLALFLVTGKF